MKDLIIVGAAVEDKFISAGIVDFGERKVRANTLKRRRVDPTGTAQDIIETWSDCLLEVIGLAPGSDIRLSIGVPNLIDYPSGVYLDNDPNRYGGLYNKNIRQLLAERLAISPDSIHINNVDANFFRGEIFAGAGRGWKKSFGIALGMGLGTARYFDGQVEDANLWKLPFKDSVFENYLSQSFLINRFWELSGIKVNDIPELKILAENPYVGQTFNEFGVHLGEFIEQVVINESPEMIVIGGQMESSYRYYYETAINYVRSKGIRTPIAKAILGEKAYVIGAAASWSESLTHS